MTEAAGLPIAASGVEGLDEILRGGFRRGQLYLVEGDTGAGKTTLAMQFLLEGARHGERAMYLGFSETPEDLEEIARSHGCSLDGVRVENVAAAAEGQEKEQYTLFPASEVELHELIREITSRIEAERPQRVVIDPVSALRWFAADAAEYRRHIDSLGHHLRSYGCTVLLIDDLHPAQAQFHPRGLVHGVIALSAQREDYGPDRRKLRVEKLRGVPVAGGMHDYRITTGGLVVYPRIDAYVRSDARRHRRILLADTPDFGPLLGGGVPPGRSVLLTGPAGTGKSTIALSWCWYAIERGDSVLFLTFDETLVNLKMRGAALGMDLDPHIEAGRLLIEKVDPASLSPGELAHRVREAAADERLGVVVLDSLSGYMHATASKRYLDLQLHQLLNYLAEHGIIGIMVLTQQGLLGEADPPVDVSYLSDIIVQTRFFEAAGALHRAISVIKHRSFRHEDGIRELQLGPEGVRLTEPLSGFRGLLTGTPQY